MHKNLELGLDELCAMTRVSIEKRREDEDKPCINFHIVLCVDDGSPYRMRKQSADRTGLLQASLSGVAQSA